MTVCLTVCLRNKTTKSRVKIIAQCKAFALYQEEHSQMCSSKELLEKHHNSRFLQTLKVDETRLGSRCTPTSISLFVYTYMSRSMVWVGRGWGHLLFLPHLVDFLIWSLMLSSSSSPSERVKWFLTEKSMTALFLSTQQVWLVFTWHRRTKLGFYPI